MRSIRRLRFAGLVLLAAAGAGDGASAQETRPATVLGNVTEEVSGAPVAGAFVILIDEAGERVTANLANNDGRYVLRADPGRYRLRVQRIGIEASLSEPVDLLPGQVVVRDLRVGTRAISLEGVSVSGEARCDIRGDRDGTMQIWELARNALDVAAWTDELGLYLYTSDIWRREYDARGRRVVAEQRDRQTRVGQQAFRSLPADSLADFGYVQGNDDDRYYYAPDAAVLLSDAFLDTHCFRTVRDGDQVGLAFEPTPGREISDIEGTLWLNDDGLLDRLDFEYTNLEGIIRTARTRQGFRAVNLGGTVRFEGLPNGGWIVRRWNIRMPAIGIEVDTSGDEVRRFLSGVVEVGAEVVNAEAREGALTFQGDRGAIRGVVLDSLGGSGIDGALVYLSGAGYSTTTGEDGSYLIEDVRPGIYQLVVEHETRAELGVEAPLVEVEALAGRITDAGETAFPSRAGVLTARCEGHALVALEDPYERRGPISVVGGVLFGENDEPVANGRVRVRWSRDGFAVSGTVQWMGVEVRSDAAGGWFVCGVPNDVRISVEAVDGEGEPRDAGIQLGSVEPGDRIWLTLRPEN